MLVEHFNSHVRYGAAMALGIACAGTGYKVRSVPLLSCRRPYRMNGCCLGGSFVAGASFVGERELRASRSGHSSVVHLCAADRCQLSEGL